MSYSSVVNNILKITVVSLLFLTIQISQLQLFPFTDQRNKITQLNFQYSRSVQFVLDIDNFVLILDFTKLNLHTALIQCQILREVTHLEVPVKCKSTSYNERGKKQFITSQNLNSYINIRRKECQTKLSSSAVNNILKINAVS